MIERGTGSIAVAMLLALAGIAAACRAQASACPPLGDEAKIELRLNDGEIRYDYGRDRKFLAGMMASDDALASAGVHVPIGLTRSRLEFRVKAEARPLRAGGQVCAYPSSAVVEIGYAVFEVFVERKYWKGTCEHDAILDHEMEHVAIDRRVLNNNRYLLEARLAEAKKHPVPGAATMEDAAQRYIEHLRRVLAPTLQLIEQQRRQRHRILDSSESYGRTHARCANW
jgi:hypothetical protein